MSITHLPEMEEPHPDERTPPSDQAAEAAVLGAVLLDGLRGKQSAYHSVVEILQPGDFYNPRHEMVWHAIQAVIEKGETPDPIVVTDHLTETGQAKRVGGAAFIHALSSGTVTSANASYHAEIVHEKAGLRRLAEVGRQFLQMAYSDGEGELGDIYARASSSLLIAQAHHTPTAKASTWTPVDLTEVLAVGDVVELPAICQRADGHCLFYRGAVHSISGEPEGGKTWLALMACAQELKEGEHVTYIDFEDRAGRVVGRLLSLGVSKEAIATRFHYIRPMEALGGPSATLLDDVAVVSTVVVLDGITEAMSLHGMDLNDQKDVAAFLHMLPRRLADLGPCVIQIDHLPKNTEDDNRFAIGAQHKLAGLDGVAYIIKIVEPFARGKIGRVKVNVVKDREGSVREHSAGKLVAELVLDSTVNGALLATLEAPRPVTRSEDGTFRPTITMQRVSEFVEASTSPVSGGQVERGVVGKGSLIRDALRVLVLEGYLQSEPGARSSVLYSSLRPYREDEDPAEKEGWG